MSRADSAADEERLVQALEAYAALQDSAVAPDRSAFLKQFPDLAAELAACLDGVALLKSAGRQLRPPRFQEPLAPEGGPRRRLGGFLLGRELGRGGMGIVYEAEEISLGRKVALKVLPAAGLEDARRRERFEHEARIAAFLEHPNIVPVHSVGREDGILFFAMRLVEGKPLSAVFAERAGRPPTAQEIRRTACWGMQIAEALTHAHSMGVVHRDVKPSNVLIDEQGNALVVDFGLARARDEASLTQTGETIGTFRYMSPEQAFGSRNAVDERTDIYSLSVTLREGICPGDDEAAKRGARRRRGTAAIPRDLQTILRTGSATDPDDRYSSASALAADLKAFLDGEAVAARRPGPVERTARWLRRRPLVLGTAAGVLLIAAVLSAFAFAATREARNRIAAHATSAEAQRTLTREAFDALFSEVVAKADEKARPTATEFVRVLQQLRPYFLSISNDQGADWSAKIWAARATCRLVDIDVHLSDRDAGWRFQLAEQRVQSLLAERPNDDEVRGLAELCEGCRQRLEQWKAKEEKR